MAAKKQDGVMQVTFDPKRIEDLKIELVDLNSVRAYKNNARTHSKAQVRQLARSIGQNGWTSPMLLDGNLEIISGHARKQAAELLGLQTVPVIILRGLNEPQKRALRIADNKIAANASWDLELLKIELSQIVIEDPELELGFEVGEIDHILSTSVDPIEEVVPAAPETAVSRPGDHWRMGAHAFIVGDCAEPAVMAQLMEGQRADAAFLDPPYNDPANKIGNSGKVKHRPIAGAAGELSVEAFTATLERWLAACAAATRDGGVHFVCMSHAHVEEVLAAGRAVYGARLNICVWRKSNAGLGALYRSAHELVFVYRVGAAQHLNNVQMGKHGRNRPNVWDAQSVNTFGGSRQQDLALHPTVKPTQLVADAIMDVTRRGDIVLDGFLGSGTTLLACERTGRICRGTEIDPIYADVIIDRFKTATGIEAVLAETGETFAQVRARREIAGGEG